jgi:hypothetical protein
MPVWLLNGEKDDLTGSTWIIILIGAVILAVTAVLVVIPMAVANRRRNPSREAVMAAAVLWGLATAWSALSIATAQFKWGHERELLVRSGYYDPATQGDGPGKPWIWWGILAGAYPGLLLLAGGRGRGSLPQAPKGNEAGPDPGGARFDRIGAGPGGPGEGGGFP